MRVYQFTQEQLFAFLGDYCGCIFDHTSEENLVVLLESLAKNGEVTILVPAATAIWEQPK